MDLSAFICAGACLLALALLYGFRRTIRRDLRVARRLLRRRR